MHFKKLLPLKISSWLIYDDWTNCYRLKIHTKNNTFIWFQKIKLHLLQERFLNERQIKVRNWIDMHLNRGKTRQGDHQESWWSGWHQGCRNPSASGQHRRPTWQRSPCAARESWRRWSSWRCSSSPPWTWPRPPRGSRQSSPKLAERPSMLDANQQWWSEERYLWNKWEYNNDNEYNYDNKI